MVAYQQLLARVAVERGICLPNKNTNSKNCCHGQLRTVVAFMSGFIYAYSLFLLYNGSAVQRKQSTILSAANIKNVAVAHHNATALSEYLAHEVRVLCMVLTCAEHHAKHAQHVLATWGKRCTKLIFVSSEVDQQLGAIKIVEPEADTYDNLWNKTREGFRYVHEQHLNDYDWFLKADDDTFIIMENLRLLLWSYNPAMPIYFGYKLKRYNVQYMSGGASYVLSREALRRFMHKSYYNETICSAGRTYGIEDFYMGICLQNAGVHLIDAKYAVPNDAKAKFFPIGLQHYFTADANNSIPDWLRIMSVSSIETGVNCCSDYAIAFHYVTEVYMHVFEYLIYKLHAFGAPSIVEVLPQRFTSEQVLEMFPLENNQEIRNLNGMSNKPDNF